MKKRLLTILMICLLLAGCGNKNAEEQPVTEATDGWYQQGSEVENQTGGAVRMYHVQTGSVTDLTMIGNRVALIEKGESTKITVMEPSDGTVLAQLDLGTAAIGLQLVYNAFAYYETNTKEAIYIDCNLQEINRYRLPDDMEGEPVFALDSSEIYYCVGQDIKAFDTNLGIVRPVRNHTCKSQKLTGVYFGGAVLSCNLEYEDGTVSNIYLSAETGEMFCKDEKITQLTTNQTKYICMRQDGTVRQYVFGTVDGEAGNMELPQNVNIAPSVKAGGIATYLCDNAGKVDLAFYDTASGMKTAALSVEGLGQVLTGYTDDNGLWFLAEKDGVQNLYYWTFELSAVADETVYSTELYTAENPDEDGLEECEDAAEELSIKYHVDVRIWEDAIYDDAEYVLTPEYQTAAINRMLGELESVLARYPDRFFYRSTSTMLRICIVRDIDGELKGVQYRHRNDPCIILAVGCDVQSEFDKAMGYVINTRVLGKSPILDEWSSLNPEGFVYGETIDDAYLAGENRAFADKTSMNSITDDRSVIFFQAMQADNAEMFKSPIMQEKLKLLCMGIRDAWGWNEVKDTFLWEQYLTEPLAPQS